jgi:MGT family glycosyltransferase
MAHGVFFNIPYYGHMNATPPLVAELTRRGDHISYYSSEAFRPAIEQAGATFRGIDTFINERTVADENLVRFSNTLIQITQAILPGLLDEMKADPPDYILHDSLCVWGWAVAQHLRIPAIASITTLARPHNALQREIVAKIVPALPSSLRMLVEGRSALRQFNAAAKQLRQTYHIPRIGLADAFNNLGDLNIVYSIRELQSWPNTFDDRFTFVGPCLDDRVETTEFPFEQLGDEPLIYISLGTVFNAKADFYRLCFQAFADSRYRVVLSVGSRTDLGAIGAIPGNFIVRPFVPQLAVLRRAALFVTHGGMNSVNEGLWEGVPLLLIPQAADQFFIAPRVQEIGAGRMFAPRQVTADRLRRAADELLGNPAYRQRCAQLEASLRHAGGPAVAADAIDTFKQARGLK